MSRMTWMTHVCLCATKFIPTPAAWHFHQLSAWVQRLSAVAIISAEVVGALLMLSPVRGQRLVAFYSQVRQTCRHVPVLMMLVRLSFDAV